VALDFDISHTAVMHATTRPLQPSNMLLSSEVSVYDYCFMLLMILHH